MILTPYSSPHIQVIRKCYLFTYNVYFETIHFLSLLLLTFCFKGPLFLRFYSCSPSISTPCKARMVTSFAIPLNKNIEYFCLPFIPEARPLIMIYRILCSMSPSNSLNYFHSLTSVSSSWSSHWFSLQFSYSTPNMPVPSCLRASAPAWMQKSSTIRIHSSQGGFYGRLIVIFQVLASSLRS